MCAQIINDPNSGNVFGRIGRGLGQGLEQATPQIMSRLQGAQQASALERAGQQQGEFNPLNATASLLRGGFNSSEASSLVPFLQQQQSRQAYLNKGENAPSEIATRKATVPSEQNVNGEIPLSQQERGSNFLEPMTQDQIQSEARNLIRSGQFTNPSEAESYVRNADATRLAGDQAFQQKQNTAVDEFDRLLPKVLQKASTFYDVNGDFNRKLTNRLKTDVARGANPTQAANKYAKEALEFAKTRQSLRDVGKKSWWNTTASGSLKSFNAIKQQYDKQGQTEEFAKDLITYGKVNPEYAYSLAYPVSENKDLNSFINSKKPFSGIGRRTGLGSKSEKQIAEYMIKNRNPKDSFLAVADKLDDLGMNKKAYFEAIQDAYNEGKLQDLTNSQKHEVEQNLSSRNTLGTVFYKSLFSRNFHWRN